MNAPISTPPAAPIPSPAAPRRTSLRGLAVTAVLITVVLMIGTGLIYPLLMTGLTQIIFPHQANGSLVTNAKGQIIGSSLIGQNFTAARYFHPRLSAAGKGYDATSSGGTNLGPTNKVLLQRTIAQANLIRKQNHLPANYPLPADAVSTSASGLDPDISPAYAYLQVARVAHARGLSVAEVRALVGKHVEGRTLGILGEPRVNVLELNLA